MNRSIEPVRLDELAGEGGAVRVTGFALDHRKVAPGNIFGAFRGARFNGEDFIAEAVVRGAVGVVTARGATVPDGALAMTDAQPRRRFAELAARFFAAAFGLAAAFFSSAAGCAGFLPAARLAFSASMMSMILCSGSAVGASVMSSPSTLRWINANMRSRTSSL
jgi:hypothetical protein